MNVCFSRQVLKSQKFITSAPPAYDAIGNMTSKAGSNRTYGPIGSGPHQARNVGGQTYSYDANGNLQNGGNRTFTWNADNLPASVTSGSVMESYTYDADGEQVAKTVGGVTTVYFQGLWEQIVGGASTRYYTFNGQVVAMRDSSTNAVTYLHGDHLGSVSLATDNSGAVVSRQDFDPWGKARGASTVTQTSLNYTGQRLDGTGLLYYHARYYDPTLARFVSADTIVPGQEDTAGTANPQNLNRYSYVNNNPINKTDPSGHCPWCVAAAVGAVVGAGIAYGAQVYANTQSGMDLGTAMTTNIDAGLVASGAVAGAVVGGTFGVASAGVIPGFTVGTAVELGAIGSGSSMAGNAIGQAISKHGQVDVGEVGVAGVVGFAAGAAAPIAATGVGAMAGGYVGSVGLGVAANAGQYVMTQQVKGESVTSQGLGASAAFGVAGGIIGGPASANIRHIYDTAEGGLSRGLNAGQLRELNVTKLNITRSFSSAFFTNQNWNFP